MSEKKSAEKGLPAEVIEEWKKKDPIKRMREHLLESGVLTNEEITALQEKYRQEVDEAFRFARESPYAPPEEVFRDVYAGGAKVE